MKKNKGFTLIELLVVIAIIGILSSVVLASLNTARNKGKDTAVKSNLNNMRSQADVYYDSNTQSYSGVCSATASSTPAGIATGVQAAGVAGEGTSHCYDSSTTWAADAPLKAAGGYWCVDSTGLSKAETDPLPSNQTNCQ